MANTASNLLGTVPAAQVSGSLPASQLSGTVSDGRLSSNVALLNTNQTFTGVNAFSNPGNNFTGSFQGNGAGLTDLSNGVPATTLVLSRTVGNPALNAAGFALDATQLGPDWLLVNSAAPWGPRSYFTAVTNIGRMWVLGGLGAVYGRNDVWSSSDGQNWSQVMTNAPWGRRQGHMTVVLNETFFVLGGITNDNSDNQVYANDVWSSQGGTNWFQVTTAARWGPRTYSASVVFNNRIWVLGGIEPGIIFRNDVWYSPDGLNWILGTTAAAWPTRQGHAAVVFNGKMWVMGGHDLSIAGYRNDVWSSADGVTWTQATNAAAWGGRQAHAALAFNERLWVLGGLGNGYYNDVWSSQGITNMLGQFYLFQKQ
jgi:N-acetylneuraminic acid mutarotase